MTFIELTLESHGRVVLPLALIHDELFLAYLSPLPTRMTEEDVVSVGGVASNSPKLPTAVGTPSRFGLPENVHLSFQHDRNAIQKQIRTFLKKRFAVNFDMLTTFDVGPVTGRVCYSTVSGSKNFVTVECPVEKLAVRFLVFGDIKIGDWMTIRGQTRVDVSTRNDGKPADPGSYYHNPHDGTNKSEWTFKQLTVGTCVFVGPPEFSEKMRETMLCMRRHLDSWERNLELSKWEETASVLRDVLKLVEHEIGERKPVPTVAVELNDV